MINRTRLQEKLGKLRQKPWRRLLIVAVLVCFFMFLSSSFWSNNNISVSFNANTSKDLTFQVFYTTQPKTNFSEKESVKQLVKAGSNKVVFKLPIKNIIKFRIDPGSNPGEVELSDITVSGNKVVNLDGKELWIWNGHVERYSFENGVLTLVSNKSDPFIVYKKELNLSKGREIDWCLFIISLAFSIFVSSVLVFYLSKFKILELRSRIEIVFLAVFFGLLLIPMSNISDAEKSIQENRMLAKFPSLYVNGKLNKAYGTDFEKWFNDRFAGRSMLINLYYRLIQDFNVYYENSRAFIAKNGWLFNKEEVVSFDDIYIKKNDIIKGVRNYLSFCKENNIKCYIQIVPTKTQLYKENLFFKNVNQHKDILALKQYLKDALDFDVIFPVNEFQKAKKQDYVYFKTDNHWTDWGAFIGYKVFMNKLLLDFTNIKYVTENDFKIYYDRRVRAEYNRKFWKGYSCSLLNLDDSRCLDGSLYKYYEYKDRFEVKDLPNMNREFYYQNGADLTGVVIGNSFTENFAYFLASSFKKIVKLRSNSPVNNGLRLSRWKKTILDNNADFVVIVISGEKASQLVELSK